MRAPISSQGPRGRRPWLWPVAVSIVLLGVAAFLLLRKTSEPERDSRTTPAFFGQSRSNYQDRSKWRPPGGSEAPAATTIRGTVYDIEGQPIAGAVLTALSFHVAGNLSAPAATAESGADGRFELRLSDGSYYLTGERDGFGPALVMAHSGDDIGIVLPRSGVVTGHVRDGQGQPITQFAIDIISPSTDDMAAPAPFASKQFSSADGSFQLGELPDRYSYLRVTAQGYAPAVSDLVKVEPGSTQTQDFTLSAGCTMKGVVKDGAGAPVPDVLINAELRKGAGAIGAFSIEATSTDESDSEGRFVLENVPVGDVAVRAYDGTHAVSSTVVTVADCQALGPIELLMTSGGGLSGVALDTSGKPVPGVKITLSHRSIGFVNATSDSDGRYRFDMLPAGGMRLQAMRGEQHTTTFVTIPEGETVEKDLTFSTGGTGEIRGRVTSGNKPLAGMALTIIANEGNGILGSRHPVTGPDGTYRVTGLPDGAYAVIVASVSRVTSAQIEGGNVATADVDIAHVPPRPSRKEVEERIEESRVPDEELGEQQK